MEHYQKQKEEFDNYQCSNCNDSWFSGCSSVNK